MHHKTLEKLVAEYKELILSNIDEAKSQMSANGLSEEDIEEVIAKATATPSEEKPKEPTKPSKAKKEEGKEIDAHTIQVFEKWSVSKEGKKIDYLRDSKISQIQADVLNRQTEQSRIAYILKD